MPEEALGTALLVADVAVDLVVEVVDVSVRRVRSREARWVAASRSAAAAAALRSAAASAAALAARSVLTVMSSITRGLGAVAR